MTRDEELARNKTESVPVKVKGQSGGISPGEQAKENRKRHRKNDTTPPPELGQNLNA